MPREKSLISLQRRAQEERQKYLDNIEYYLKQIKESAEELDPDSKVIVFGSFVKDNMKIDSDVDVLVITYLAGDTEDRIKVRMAVAGDIGVYSPFEFHIATWEEYTNWYKDLIDESREIKNS
jgi:hypothetical protein